MKETRQRAVLLFLAAVAVRLLFCFVVFPVFAARYATVGAQYFFDTYREIAANLLGGFGYVAEPAGEPVLNRAPGYVAIMLLAAPGSGYCAALVHWWNSILGGMAAMLTFFASFELTSSRHKATFAGMVVTLWPFLIWETKVTVPENLIAALVPLLAWILARYFRSGLRTWLAIAAGGAVGWLVLCHGFYQPLVVLLPAAMLFKDRKTSADYRAAALVLGAALLVVVPWMLRNAHIAGHFVGTATGFGFHYFKGEYYADLLLNGGPYFSDRDPEAVLSVSRRLQAAGYPLQPDTVFRSDPEANRFLAQQAVSDMLQHPGRQVLKGSVRFFLAWVREQTPARSLFNALFSGPLLLLAVWGAWCRRRSRVHLALLLIMVFVNFTVAVVFPEAIPMRYVLPLVPLAAVLAAEAVPDKSCLGCCSSAGNG